MHRLLRARLVVPLAASLTTGSLIAVNSIRGSSVAAEEAQPEGKLTPWAWLSQRIWTPATAEGSPVVEKPLLPDAVAPPYGRPLTLVISDSVLIATSFHPDKGWIHAKRPGLDWFLAQLAQHYEIVIFSSSLYGDAGPVLDRADPGRMAPHRLFGDSLRRSEDGRRVKPVSRLGRPLDKVVVIEDDPGTVEGAALDNVILLKPWSADTPEGREDLLDVVPLLELFAAKKVPDVRPYLRKYHEARVYVPALYRQQRISYQVRQDKQLAAALQHINFVGSDTEPAAAPPTPGTGAMAEGEEAASADGSGADGSSAGSRTWLGYLSGGWLGK